MRRASETEFPYGWPGKVCYFRLVGVGGDPVQLKGRDEFRQAVIDALEDDVPIFATWPGQYRTDLFVIDEPQLLAEAIGLAVPA